MPGQEGLSRIRNMRRTCARRPAPRLSGWLARLVEMRMMAASQRLSSSVRRLRGRSKRGWWPQPCPRPGTPAADGCPHPVPAGKRAWPLRLAGRHPCALFAVIALSGPASARQPSCGRFCQGRAACARTEAIRAGAGAGSAADLLPDPAWALGLAEWGWMHDRKTRGVARRQSPEPSRGSAGPRKQIEMGGAIPEMS